MTMLDQALIENQNQPNYLPKDPPDLPKEPKELPSPQNQVHTLLSWTAPGRPFRKRKKEFYLSSLLIMFLVEIILFLFSEYVLMLVILSLVFVSFALVTVPPHDFHYRISSEGITIEDHFFLWQELYDFYFRQKDNLDILHIRTHVFIPGELTITLGDMPKEHVKSVLLPYLPFREYIKPTFMENAADWLSKNFPLERENTPEKTSQVAS